MSKFNLTTTMMSSKTLINSPATLVVEALDGLLLTHPELVRVGTTPDVKVIMRGDWDAKRADKVAIISGGGSGHEPAHAGYVGSGMLTAAVCGEVFASPTTHAVLAAIRAAAGPKGVLVIIKNYTGDRLSFGKAAEAAKAEGIAVETVFVGDDCAIVGTRVTGRRGIAGTVFVHKVAGAVAERGGSLAEVYDAALRASREVRSIGVALSSCSLPGKPASDRLADATTMEVGLGIHGEPGAERCALLSADAVADVMVDRILADFAATPAVTPSVTRVAALVNNLGASTPLEVSVVAARVVRGLRERGIAVDRVACGSLMTALDMHGVSLSLLPLDDARVAQLDAPSGAFGWPAGTLQRPAAAPAVVPAAVAAAAPLVDADAAPLSPASRQLAACVASACEAVQSVVAELTRLDTAVGDGDCGLTFERAATRVGEAVAAALRGDASEVSLRSPRLFLLTLGACLRVCMGGTSGAIFDIMTCAAAAATPADATHCEPAQWTAALHAATEAAMKHGNAAVGDATMIDALHPAVAAMQRALAADAAASGRAVLAAGADAAHAGAAATATMVRGAGRASYVSADAARGIEDPGAVAIATLLRGLAAAV